MLTLDLIEEAAKFLEGVVRRTPLEESPALCEATGVATYLKLEALQVTGRNLSLQGLRTILGRVPAQRDGQPNTR